MKKYFLLLLITLAFFSACDKEKVIPVINSPIASVALNDAVAITFSYTSEAGFKSASVSSSVGTANITIDGVAGATEGNVVVTFNAPASTGAAVVTLTIVDSEDQQGLGSATVEIKSGISVTGNITENTTWETGKVYILETRVTVVSGITLTIQPGVVIKGAAGTGSNATALLIARGGKIEAAGTAAQPIIFTSVADNILPGQIASPNLSPDLDGLWGGLIVLGKARISVSGDVETKQIEGIPPSDANGLYGGTNDADNSGTIKYVSIRHGGANIGEGNEINGLTLGGVGSATTIQYVEVIANQDDGIEWFGGAVNVTNAVVWNCGDDAIDTDQSWNGILDNFVVVNAGDKCFELDGPEGSTRFDNKNHMIKNGTIKAGNAVGLVDIDDANNAKDSNVDMMNLYFYNVKVGQTFDAKPLFYAYDFSNFEIVLPASTSITDFFKKGTDAYATAVAAGANTVGADLTKFNTWSWARVSQAF